MTTHELAGLLDCLRQGFGDGLKQATKDALSEASEAFRELPSKTLKELVKEIKSKPGAGSSKKAEVDVPQLIARVRMVRAGTLPATEVEKELELLKNPQLKEILVSFGSKGTTKTEENRVRARALLVHTPNGPTPSPELISTPVVDQNLVEQGVELYTRLRDTQGLSILEVRAQFEPIRHYPKPVVEEISRRVGYTPYGTRDEVANRMLSNLEGIKLHQRRGEMILTGT